MRVPDVFAEKASSFTVTITRSSRENEVWPTEPDCGTHTHTQASKSLFSRTPVGPLTHENPRVRGGRSELLLRDEFSSGGSSSEAAVHLPCK